jgi:hypothetical protein
VPCSPLRLLPSLLSIRIACCLLATAALGAQEVPRKETAVLLHHDLRVGATFRYEIDVQAALKFQETALDSTMRFVLHFDARVDEVRNGLAKVAHRLHRIETKTKSPVADTDYDSARPDADKAPAGTLPLLIDKVFVTYVDRAGHIERVLLPDSMPRGARNVAGADFESLFELYFLPFPSQRVELDRTWDSSMQLVDASLGTGSSARVTNRLAAIHEGKAYIERVVHLHPPPVRPKVTFEITKATGNAELDIATGRLLRAELQLQATAARDLGQGRTARGTSSVTYTVRPAPPAPPAPPGGR